MIVYLSVMRPDGRTRTTETGERERSRKRNKKQIVCTHILSGVYDCVIVVQMTAITYFFLFADSISTVRCVFFNDTDLST